MTVSVRIVQDPELGEVQPETLTIFGQAIGKDYTKADFTDAELAKVRNNRFFQIKGDPLDHDQNGKKGGSVPPAGEGYEAMTVPNLKALAAERSVDLGDATKKGDIIAALQLADEAAAQDAEDEA